MGKPVWTKDIYPQFKIGDYTYGHPKILGKGVVSIGRFCSIANGCLILLGVDHRIDWLTTYPFSALFPEAAHIQGHPRTKGPVIIGNDVWIGQNVTILSNVRIGNGAIIGAGSVVTKDVRPFAVVTGNPAVFRHIRFHSYDACRRLEELAWWDWDIETIKRALPDLLCKPELSKLLQD